MINGSSTYWYSRPSNAATINVKWSETSLNEVNNLSLMTIIAELKRSSGTTTGTFAGTLYVRDADTNDLIYSSPFSTKKTWGTTYQDIFSKSGISIPHNDNGSKNIKIYIEMTQGGTTLAGDYYFNNSPIALTSIPRRSKINNTTFNVEGNTTLDITKYVEGYYHHLVCYTFNVEGTEYVPFYYKIYAENGNIVTLIEDELNDYYDQNVNRAITSIKISLETYSDFELTDFIGKDEKIITYNIVNAPPTFSSFDINDGNEDTLLLTGSSVKIIKGYSDCIISNVVVEAQKQANIKNLNINGVLYTYVEEGTYNIGLLTSRTISIYAIDTRGFSSLLSNIVSESNWIDYSKLEKISQEWLRTNNTEEETTIKFSGKVFSGNFGSISNEILTSYRYKKSDTSTWTTGITSIVPGIVSGIFSFDNVIKGDTDEGFSIEDSFNVEITISDKLSQVVFEYLVNSGSPADAIYKNCIAVGGKYDETLGGRLQLLGKHKVSDSGGKLLIGDLEYGVPLDWISASETWTYSSVDDPTGVITISGDKTSKYCLGMRIKFTNGGNTIYGIITKISYSSPNTTLTFLHEIDPADSLALYLMANSAITNNYYSKLRYPIGFPTDKNKWSVIKTYNTNQYSSPATSYSNPNGIKLDVPIGDWYISLKGAMYATGSTGKNYIFVYGALSTSTSSVSDAELSMMGVIGHTSAVLSDFSVHTYISKDINVTAKTSYYPIAKQANAAGTINCGFQATNDYKLVIKAASNYL